MAACLVPPAARAVAAGVALALAACAPTLQTPDDEPLAEPDAAPGDDSTVSRVDATDYDLWAYYDLETMALVEPDGAETSEEWDLGFRRDKIKINGGVSGSGGMEVAVVLDTDFLALARAPVDGYATDQPDSEIDENEDPDYVFSVVEGGWYDYNPATHVLTPKLDRVYVVRSVESNHYKLAILSYYDPESGDSAHFEFRWIAIDAPASAR